MRSLSGVFARLEARALAQLRAEQLQRGLLERGVSVGRAPAPLPGRDVNPR